MKLPFRFLPGSWGLVGDAYDEAEAHYLLTGDQLERRLIEIRYKHDPIIKAMQLLEADLRYGRVDEYTHACGLNALQYPNEDERRERQLDIDVQFNKVTPYDAAIRRVERKFPNEDDVGRRIALLDVELQFDKVYRHQYDKQCATLRNEPWVAIVHSGFDLERGVDGVYFEIDWNPQWVELLKDHGFSGRTAEQIVDGWFSEVCRSYGTIEEPQSADVLQFR